MAANDAKPILYYHDLSLPSRKVLMALHEKRVDFRPRPVQIFEGEQFNTWYLCLNPRGEVPVLQDGPEVVVDSSKIIEYIDAKFGHPRLLAPKDNPKVEEYVQLFNTVPLMALTYGVSCFHAGQTTDVLRYPYCQEQFLVDTKQMLLHRPVRLREEAQKQRGQPAEEVLRHKAEMIESLIQDVFLGRDKIHSILYDLEAILDRIEAELATDDRAGPWLCGMTFSAADISLTALLVRLYQLGLDERYWKGGVRPNLSVYQELAFRRPSVLKATKWKDHEYQVMRVSRSQGTTTNGGGSSSSTTTTEDTHGHSPEPGMTRSDSIDAARVGLGALLVMGGIYACKKLLKK